MPLFQSIEPILGRDAENVAISNSEIQTFKGCRRRWMLGSYYGLSQKEENLLGPLPLGTRIHNALEAYYRFDKHPVDEYTRLLNEDLKKFYESPDAQFEDKEKKFNSEAELGRLMIEGYFEWVQEEGLDAEIEFIEIEGQNRVRLTNDPRVELIGKTDAKVRKRSDGSVYILDHKTAAPSNFGDYQKYINHTEQLKFYVMLERYVALQTDDHRVDGGIYNVLKKVKRSKTAKPPFFDRLEVRFNDKTISNMWIRTLGTIRDIMNTRDALDADADHNFVAYPTQKMDWTCGTCPFFQMCNMIDDGSDYEEYALEFLKQVDPNERYNDEKESNG